jgi:tripartite-type tricarboxylate transporter receptor subunit TctC
MNVLLLLTSKLDIRKQSSRSLPSISIRYVLKITSACIGIALSLGLSVFPVAGQDFPERPIRVVIPFAPGGTAEPVARLLADGIKRRTSATVVIESRPGASGNLGTSEVARATPDGYSLLLASNTQLTVNQFLFKSRLVRSHRDFTLITILAEQCQVVYVPANFPAKTMLEMLNQIKAHPGKYNYASPGVGTGPHLSGELLSQLYGLQMVHVPFSGGVGAINAMMSGDVQLLLTALSVGKGQVDSGALRVLAVTSATRMASLPDVPTTAEAGTPEYTNCTWWSLVGPKGVAPSIVTWLQQKLTEVLHEEATKARLEELGFTPIGTTSDEFQERVKREEPIYQHLIQTRKLAIE